jgi:uncharacterized membrane protein
MLSVILQEGNSLNDKGNCEACGQKIQNTVFDKCMYCGTALPKYQSFSAAEKEAVLAKQKQAELDEAKLSKSKPNKHFGGDSGGGFLGGDSGDFGGSCD